MLVYKPGEANEDLKKHFEKGTGFLLLINKKYEPEIWHMAVPAIAEKDFDVFTSSIKNCHFLAHFRSGEEMGKFVFELFELYLEQGF